MDDKSFLDHYREETLKICLKNIKFTALIVFFGSPLFLLLDYLLAPEKMSGIIVVRAAMMFGVLVIYFISKTKHALKYSMWLGVATGLWASITITILVHMTGGSSSPYYAGLLIVLFALCIWIPITFRLGLLSAVIIYLMYALPFLVTNTVTDWPIFINNNYFTLFIFFLSVTSLKFYNDIRFNEFKARFEIQQAKEELERIDQLKSQFFANVSHEVRTPLTSIIAPIQSMYQGDVGDLSEDQHHMLEQVYRNTLRLLDLINQMLDFAKIEAGRMLLRLEKVSVDELILDMVAIFEEITEKKGIKLRFSKEGEIPEFALDHDKMERILTNLIRNAIKFTESGSIYVRARVENHSLVIDIEDTGIGIPADHLPHVFERFRQVDASSTRRYEGTGLGLTIVKESVDLMQGKISVESEEGKGTRFRIEFPVNLEEVAPDALIERRSGAERREGADDTTGEKRTGKVRRREDLAKVTLADLALIEGRVKQKKVTTLEEEHDAENSSNHIQKLLE